MGMRRKAALALALGLAGAAGACALGGAEGESARPVELRLDAGARAVFAGGIELRSSRPTFGGLSGIEVSADGRRFVAVSDAGRWVEGALERGANERLTGWRLEILAGMLGPDGARAAYSERDAEGLDIAAPDLSGPRLVSFERDHRIARFAGPRAPEELLWSLRAWSRMPINNGFEALARRPDGALLAIQEADAGPGRQAAQLLFPDGRVLPLALPREKGLIITGADFGPDGRLYVVDRGLSFWRGFHMRLRRLTLEGARVIAEEELARISGVMGADNAEGISIWRDGAGRLRALVATDDNFNMLQRTLLLEFILPEADAPQAGAGGG
ncbi:esterase-like activity of phytase family protein [Oceanicella actignis]|uniref:esterase-like activity of phytase family protein n=1 Tax=Oceanicella actignis TaxID=1189325 RepID=UPI0011E79798|nr:esterase-like activity of phytase family protein [Oceanicella actignis]TYO85419.1 hypothetical protein LY05_02530 [Oceanicella actignis]